MASSTKSVDSGDEILRLNSKRRHFLRDKTRKPKFPKFEQSSQVIAENGESVRLSILANIESEDHDTPKTLYELFERAVRLNGGSPFVGERAPIDAEGEGRGGGGKSRCFTWTTYEEVFRQAKCIGAALLARLGVKAGDRVGITGTNSPKYLTTTFACVAQSVVLVPLYHNYKFDDIVQIANNCELEVIFCDSVERARQLLAKQERFAYLKHIVLMSESKDEMTFDDERGNLEVFGWREMLKIGDEKCDSISLNPPSPEDIYVICHTSGTTGTPKGVQLSHRALLAAAIGGLYRLWCLPPHNYAFDSSDSYLSFLSPAHSYEQLMQTFIIYLRGRIGVFGGNLQNLMEDARLLRPTIVSMVPRLLEKFRQQISGKMDANPLLHRVFQLALKAKLGMLAKGRLRYDTLYDRFVFRPLIHRAFGGRLRLITTGGAPITSDTMNFSRCVYGCPVFEGYGQTECCAAGTLSLPGDTSTRHVGGPSPWAQVKLVDVSELGYSACNGRGEICFRGDALMSGYFKDDALTAKTIDAQDWLHTGDIGEWLPNGTLQVIDRKRHFFKLSQGDFVAPEQIESVYAQHVNVLQIFVTGRTTESFLVAIVVTTKALASNDKESRQKFVKNLRELGATKGLNGLEQIQNVHLTCKDFSLENEELLTTTLKLKRAKMNEYFASAIEEMYREGPLI